MARIVSNSYMFPKEYMTMFIDYHNVYTQFVVVRVNEHTLTIGRPTTPFWTPEFITKTTDKMVQDFLAMMGYSFRLGAEAQGKTTEVQH